MESIPDIIITLCCVYILFIFVVGDVKTSGAYFFKFVVALVIAVLCFMSQVYIAALIWMINVLINLFLIMDN